MVVDCLRRSVTQEDQNEIDFRERKKIMDELIGGWMDRLQQMSIIVSTFHPVEIH